jgi:hypothetical protein
MKTLAGLVLENITLRAAGVALRFQIAALRARLWLAGLDL